ncbi:MAG: hypothetical protein F6K26_05765 [Moorea sp. SIO2I5]|nr:hypothetical protein [Moorena sp. SIO2I5]
MITINFSTESDKYHHCSLFPVPCSLFISINFSTESDKYHHCSLFPIPCYLLP